MNQQEIEVKYYIADLENLESKLLAAGAELIEPKVMEINLRFDTPDEALSRRFQVLRLRRDWENRLTFKGPMTTEGGVRLRQEIEFTVSDFEAAGDLLEALGFVVAMRYEKQRTTYRVLGALVSLDIMPYGTFCEIEGPDVDALNRISVLLGLDWEAAIPESYTTLFQKLRERLGLEFRDLSFENFAGIEITPADLQVRPADI